MAIDSRGQVTTTGMLNKPNMNVQVPNMSNLIPPKQEVKQPVQKVKQPIQVATQPVDNTSRESGIVENIQRNITAEDMTVLEPVLSPSVKRVLAKIMPEITSLLEGVGSNEETIPVKFSVIDSLPTEVQNFILEANNPQTMDNNNVPLDTQTAQAPSGMMAPEGLPEQDDSDVDISQELV